ncbi:hypothetical protein ALC62_06783 [Cyphomyrmex costatus]|uniref:Uncharacterized protein n=1 Tax=Cyphomyrmex costatus TaxID=456900 RepID=A0A195CNT9_9HYME|nr:hypothetical protein ALC62_06783 [Cyphomyrmex costatus]
MSKLSAYPGDIRAKAASSIIHDPDVTPRIDVKTTKFKVADVQVLLTLECVVTVGLLTFWRTILSLIIYDLDVIARLRSDIDYSIAVIIWQGLGTSRAPDPSPGHESRNNIEPALNFALAKWPAKGDEDVDERGH